MIALPVFLFAYSCITRTKRGYPFLIGLPLWWFAVVKCREGWLQLLVARDCC